MLKNSRKFIVAFLFFAVLAIPLSIYATNLSNGTISSATNVTGNTANATPSMGTGSTTTNTTSLQTSPTTSNTVSTTSSGTTTTTTSSSSTNPQRTSVNTSSSLPESTLGLSNILSIFMIVIGVLLILLGIAVFIRLKK